MAWRPRIKPNRNMALTQLGSGTGGVAALASELKNQPPLASHIPPFLLTIEN